MTVLGPAAPRRLPYVAPLPLSAARLDPASLLGNWQELNAAATIPHCLENIRRTGVLENFSRLTEEPPPGKFEGFWFADSDLYKTLEAIGWEMGRSGTDQWAEVLSEVADLLERVQEPDGYLNTYVQGTAGKERFGHLEHSHELYCAGHLLQAAVALHRGGGDTRILAIARRVADLIVTVPLIDGHPEVETALIELYRETGEESYLSAAELQVERRGQRTLTGGFGPQYYQDHLPVREATEAIGHSVRQLYLAAGVTDLYLENGDESLLKAMEQLWDSAFGSKLYLTGGHGSRHRDEAYGDPYELPPDRAYAETCASIAALQWCWRMLLATGQARYAEEMERALFNAIAASMTTNGTAFFYSNPLQLRSGHDGSSEDAPSERLPWYACACCPPNLARLLASLHGYAATADGSGLQLHLLTAGTFSTDTLTAVVETGYPWDGDLVVTVSGHGELAIRVPSWATDATLEVTDAKVLVEPVPGAYVRVACEDGATVRLSLPMTPRLTRADERVDAVRGCVAIERGPLVYCVEQADLADDVLVEQLRLDASAPITEERTPDDLTPVRLRLGAVTRSLEAELYKAYQPDAQAGTAITVTAIPYHAWANRGPGAMRVWLPLN
ncbi:glycoside hydrolase family 127 protein [Kribbella albertanoniae]|uniref:Glycoside hydrolase family 127 protein n=1 Tax=Kribbella albertanoniae TaxID=1266829 RepID=A0A4V2XR17_9ACTN|nr:beta-L-arabinofuranosidase domain-containing protein [Kribbella albertanoniae]TDC28195.1 glycoside hydrolase family 127 protein [Kribbella albertanoniae]